VVGNRRLRDIFKALENAGPAYRAEAVDEYRELAMLARAWERSASKPGTGTEEAAPGAVDDTKDEGRRGPI
jgi:hypothetical protein